MQGKILKRKGNEEKEEEICRKEMEEKEKEYK